MNPKSDKQNKLKLTVNTLTIKSLETKAAPISTRFCDGNDTDTCDWGGIGKVAAVAYF